MTVLKPDTRKNPLFTKISLLYLFSILIIITVNYNSVFGFYFRYDTFVWLDKTIFDPVNLHYFFNYNKASPYFMPLANAIFLLCYKVFKLEPAPYHITIMLTHIINVLLVYYVAKRLTHNAIAAFTASILFGISPATAEPAVYIAAFHHALATSFIMIAFLFFIRFQESAKPRCYLLSLLFYLLALLTKQIAITTPILLLAYEYLQTRKPIPKKALLKYGPFIVASLIYLTSNKSIADTNYTYAPIQEKYYQIGMHIVSNYFDYLRYMALPFDAVAQATEHHLFLPLNALYSFSKNAVFIAFIVLLMAGIFKKRRLLFFFLWSTISLLPILPFKFPVQSRYAYLPAVGFYGMVAIMLCDTPMIKKRIWRYLILFLIIVCFMGSQAEIYRYNIDYIFWKNLTTDAKNYCGNLSVPKPAKLYLLNFPQLALSKDDEINSALRVALLNPFLEVTALYPCELKMIEPDSSTYFLEFRGRRLWPIKKETQ